MKIKCIIVDDEQLAIDLIKNHLNKIDDFQIIQTFTEPLKAFQIIENENLDVIFLDINMPQVNGFNFIKNLNVKPLIVFSTAYREYAIKSYEFDVLDYLVKPISFDRFLKTINKIRHNIYNKNNSHNYKLYQEPHVFFRSNKKLLKVKLNEILFLESLKDYVKVTTVQENIIIHNSLSAITEELDSLGFLRVHNSFTISISKVDALDGNTLEIKNHKILTGRKYQKEAKKMILDNLI